MTCIPSFPTAWSATAAYPSTLQLRQLRLRLAHADLRLTETGRRLGLVGDEQWRRFEEKREAIERERQRLRETWLKPAAIGTDLARAVLGDELRREARALDLLARPKVGYAELVALPGLGPGVTDPQVAEQLDIQAKYAGYIDRQQQEINRHRAQEETALPPDFPFDQVRGLSSEVREKLLRVRPTTLGQAARIPGLTPAAISLLLIHLRRRSV